MFTKQHYEVIAELIKDFVGDGMKIRGSSWPKEFANTLADFFEKDNPNFDRERFLKKAIGGP